MEFCRKGKELDDKNKHYLGKSVREIDIMGKVYRVTMTKFFIFSEKVILENLKSHTVQVRPKTLYLL